MPSALCLMNPVDWLVSFPSQEHLNPRKKADLLPILIKKVLIKKSDSFQQGLRRSVAATGLE